MRVTILNKDEVLDLFRNWGEVSSVCYKSIGRLESIGKHCLKSEHFSGSRCEYIKFRIDDVPRFLIDQIVRKEIGTVKNVESMRYVDKCNFNYEIPSEILDCESLVMEYKELMHDIMDMYEWIQSHILNKGLSQERANEQARYILPMATDNSVVVAFTIESIMDYMHSRLCTRTEDIHRTLAYIMRDELVKLLPELETYLVPKCEYLLWCPENKSCGRKPKKGDLIDRIKTTEISPSSK